MYPLKRKEKLASIPLDDPTRQPSLTQLVQEHWVRDQLSRRVTAPNNQGLRRRKFEMDITINQ